MHFAATWFKWEHLWTNIYKSLIMYLFTIKQCLINKKKSSNCAFINRWAFFVYSCDQKVTYTCKEHVCHGSFDFPIISKI